MPEIVALLIVSVPAWAGWLGKYRSGENLLAAGKAGHRARSPSGGGQRCRFGWSHRDAQLSAVYDAQERAGMSRGQCRDGKQNFDWALRLAADGPVVARAAVTSHFGQGCQALGELAHAEQLFRRAPAAMANSSDLSNLLGSVLALPRQYQEAEEASSPALSNPADSALHCAMRSSDCVEDLHRHCLA